MLSVIGVFFSHGVLTKVEYRTSHLAMIHLSLVYRGRSKYVIVAKRKRRRETEKEKKIEREIQRNGERKGYREPKET